MSTRKVRTIQVDALARVEGEGAMEIEIDGDRVSAVRLRIYEPPRFFEALLRGRAASEAPDITARICGICPVAYQMSACAAIEDALGITIPEPIRLLRRLLYCGEWIQSHTLHVTMLHAPDFLGYDGAIAMAKDHKAEVERGLRLKRAGNAILHTLGGREVHPVNVRIGGFHRAPTRADLRDLREQLAAALHDAEALVAWTSGFTCPDFAMPREYVALRAGDDYPMERGRIVSTHGLDIEVAAFNDHFVEEQAPHSTALHARLRERGTYFLGPLARFALNFDRLDADTRELARATSVVPPVDNPFRSIVIRALEVHFACAEAIRIIDGYAPPVRSFVEPTRAGGIGHGVTEAPRGLLYHRYRVADDGLIELAQITPPTSQNQRAVEEDLAAFVAPRLHLPQDELCWQCEQAIRNYDPCISCATHFLTLDVRRKDGRTT